MKMFNKQGQPQGARSTPNKKKTHLFFSTSNKYCTTGGHPCSAARCNGADPKQSVLFLSAPASTRARTTSKCPCLPQDGDDPKSFNGWTVNLCNHREGRRRIPSMSKILGLFIVSSNMHRFLKQWNQGSLFHSEGWIYLWKRRLIHHIWWVKLYLTIQLWRQH